MNYYASLTGPLLGLYFPLPDELVSHNARACALNTSRLSRIWCSVYTREEALASVEKWGGSLLDDRYAARLDYDSYAVLQIAGQGDAG